MKFPPRVTGTVLQRSFPSNPNLTPDDLTPEQSRAVASAAPTDDGWTVYRGGYGAGGDAMGAGAATLRALFHHGLADLVIEVREVARCTGHGRARRLVGWAEQRQLIGARLTPDGVAFRTALADWLDGT